MTETGPGHGGALASVDEALASGRASAQDPALRELQDLALAIEAESELPRDEFARELEQRVAAGFPRRRRLRVPRIPSVSRGRALALAGAAATLLVVIGVALSATGDRGHTDVIADGQVADPALDARAPDRVPPTAALDGTQQRLAPGAPKRRIERSAELTLAAPADRLESVGDSVVRVTDRHRGFVLRSSVSSGAESDRGGSFDLRIPASELQPAVSDLSRLGHVRARRQAGRDITPAFTSARDRLGTATAERRGLLRRLAAAGSDQEVTRLRSRLDSVALRIERLRNQVGGLRERTNYASVTVDLEADRGSRATPGATRRALDDSLNILVGSLNLAVRALGILLPVGLVGALGWAAARILRRRRREAALR